MAHFTSNINFNAETSNVTEAAARLNDLAQNNIYDESWRTPAIQAALDTAWEGFEFEEIISLIADVYNVSKNERLIFEEIVGLEVFFVSVGGQIDQSEISSEKWEIPRERVGFQVSELVEKLEANFSRVSGSLTERAQQQLAATLNTRLLGLYQAATPSGSPYYSDGAGVSLAWLNEALTAVKDSTLGGPVSIIGRATMTDKIQDELLELNGFTPETNEGMLRRGVLGSYRGANIIELKNYKDAQGVSRVPSNELFVVGRDAAKVAYFGAPVGDEWIEPGDFYWKARGYRDVGMLVHKPENIRRYVDTSDY